MKVRGSRSQSRLVMFHLVAQLHQSSCDVRLKTVKCSSAMTTQLPPCSPWVHTKKSQYTHIHTLMLSIEVRGQTVRHQLIIISRSLQLQDEAKLLACQQTQLNGANEVWKMNDFEVHLLLILQYNCVLVMQTAVFLDDTSHHAFSYCLSVPALQPTCSCGIRSIHSA